MRRFTTLTAFALLLLSLRGAWAADASMSYAIPESGEVGLLYDCDDNHGGGLATGIYLVTFSGSLTDLANEYPSVH